MLLVKKETAENYERRVFEEIQYSGHAFEIYWMYGKIYSVLFCGDKLREWFSGAKKKKNLFADFCLKKIAARLPF